MQVSSPPGFHLATAAGKQVTCRVSGLWFTTSPECCYPQWHALLKCHATVSSFEGPVITLPCTPRCKRGYEGENCAVPVCSKSPCPPDSDCLMRSFAYNGYICVHNPCAFHPCQSGEICLTDREKPKGYKCTDDPCSSTKCYNGGTCVFDKATETVGCECVPPFSQSSDCFHVLGCHSELRPCQNSGTCTDKFVCECSEGEWSVVLHEACIHVHFLSSHLFVTCWALVRPATTC